MTWQPITTAPKDGSWILLAVSGAVKAHIGTWSGGHWEKDGEGLRLGYVTHWMPLPEPPS